MVGATVLALSQPGFSLHWTHSVERVEWAETWQIATDGLHLTEARVRGSGAGMEPGEDAVLQDGWWVWQPGTVVADLHLAASGATGAGWRLCDGPTCHQIGQDPSAAIRIAPCPAPDR